MGLFIMLLVVGVVIYLSSNVAKANRKKWESAARQLNLVFNVGGGGRIGSISGKIQGHDIAISTFTRGSGSSTQTYTKYVLEYRDRILTDFKMVPQGLRHDVGKAFGLQDIEVGNPLFDDQILLQGGHPAKVMNVLTPQLQEEIRILMATYPDTVITNELIAINRRGTDTDSAVIRRLVRRITAFGNLMSDHETPESADIQFGDGIDPLVTEPIEPSFGTRASSNPRVPEPQWIEISEEDAAVEPDPEPETVIKEAPVSLEPVVEVGKPGAESDPISEASETIAPDTLDLRQIAAELSGGGSGQSLTVAKLFDQQYKGRRVEGTGILQRVNKFSYDMVFRNCRGVKAVFEICELAGPYSRIKVSAVVKYPSEEYDALLAQDNASLTISGTLVAFDSMMHQYFIEP